MSDAPIQFRPQFKLGDYVLKSLITKFPDRELWLAEQVSVKRMVQVVCYHGNDTEDFLHDVRAKAMVDDGVFGLVYEAVEFEGFTAYVGEVLPEKNLEKLEARTISALEIAQMLSQIAGALYGLNKKGIAYHDLIRSDVRFDDQMHVRLRNVACARKPKSDQATRDMLVTSLRPLLQVGDPGATRIGTLLDYIQGLDEKLPLPWIEVQKLAHQISEQLSEAVVQVTRRQPMVKSAQFGPNIMLIGILTASLIMLIGFFTLRNQKARNEAERLLVNAGSYHGPDYKPVEVGAFLMDVDEVTIDEYSAFLVAWGTMSEAERARLYPSDAPAEKGAPRPDHWSEYYIAARKGEKWQGHQISLAHPVTGVDWWDAMAFAKWKGGDLPTELQWWAAISSAIIDSSERVSIWRPVLGKGKKITGLSGNVAEWSRLRTKNPSFPMKSIQPVALGGSFLNSTQGASHRAWLESPAVRRDDLGFRVVYPVEQ